MSGGDLFGFLQHKRVNGPFGYCATGGRFLCVGAIGEQYEQARFWTVDQDGDKKYNATDG